MDDYVDVVDVESESQPVASTSAQPEQTASGRPRRAAAARRLNSPAYSELDADDAPPSSNAGRSTRSGIRTRIGSGGGGGGAPKLKLKLSEKAAALAPGMSFLGQYDRELDSDDEDLTFEEHFILRMPPGEDLDKMRKMVADRALTNDVWFKFKDARRAIFHIGNHLYSAKLVDLPCIIESQKTMDGRQMFKVADICQMLVVDARIPSEDALGHQKPFSVEDFVWPHGVTPPLRHVRKRRFRKRASKRTIESVEQEVERLLQQDELASDMKYDVLENVNPDLSDSEFLEREDAMDAATPGAFSEAGDAATPAADGNDGPSEEEHEPEGDIDEELAAELDLALNDEDDDDEERDDDDDESDVDEEDEDDEDDEKAQARKLLTAEIADLEQAVHRREVEAANTANPIIRRRFDDMLRKMKADLANKVAHRDRLIHGAKPAVDEDDGSEGDDEEDEEMQDAMAMAMPPPLMPMPPPPPGPPLPGVVGPGVGQNGIMPLGDADIDALFGPEDTMDTD